MEHLAVSTGEIALVVYVAIIAGDINAYSASIAKKNGGISAYVEHLTCAAGGIAFSLLLLAASP